MSTSPDRGRFPRVGPYFSGGEAIAQARTTAEGQAGMQAFLERQKPPWIEKTNGK